MNFLLYQRGINIKSKTQRLILAVFVLIFFAGLAPFAFAANNLSVARLFRTANNVIDGDLVSQVDKDTVIAAVAGQKQIVIGVVDSDAPIVLRPLEETNTATQTVLVSTDGDVGVNIADNTSAIKSGDLIAVSNIPGKAAKASGNPSNEIIGISLDDYDGSSQLTVQLQPGHVAGLAATGTIFDRLLFSVLRNFELVDSGALFFRYLIAGIIVIGAIFITFNTLGRNITTGIMSVGRNPLSKGSIQAMLFYNVILIAAIDIAAIIFALFLIQL